MNEIIKKRRLEKNLTQEQMANLLGVTAPAVHKWEKGTSYPDIVLLPALARLLDTDLNTLLSFKEELTTQEIGMFLNHLSAMANADGFEKAYHTAMEKLKEYPTCDMLLLNVALFLEGSLIFHKSKDNLKDYEKKIESLYERALNSPDLQVKSQAQSMIISKYMRRKEYDKAYDLLQMLPDENPIDKNQLQVNLLAAKGEYKEAATLAEKKLLAAATKIYLSLLTLMEIAIKDGRLEDAKYIADASKESTRLFDLWDYHSYVAHFQFHTLCKNQAESLKVLKPMLNSLTHKWEMNTSPLYRHIKTKESDFGPKLKETLIHSIAEDEQTSFLKDNEEFQNILKEIENE